jgi:hypothetical protein
VPKDYWKNKEAHKSFLMQYAREHNMQSPSDWGEVTTADFRRSKGASLYNQYGGIKQILQTISPEYKQTNKPVYKNERAMLKILKQIFPQFTIIDSYKHPDIRFVSTRRPGQLDAFIGDLAIAFEYQGEQHYNLHMWGTQRAEINDEEKRNVCRNLGITLIEVPFWWDKSQGQLEAAIWRVRPDLIAVPMSIVPFRDKSEVSLKPKST